MTDQAVATAAPVAPRLRRRLEPRADWTEAGWTADLATLSALLLLTAAFGRPFSKLHVPGVEVYVTEIALLAIGALTLRRCGLGGVRDRIRPIPLVPLLLFWLAGGVAALRGLPEFGLGGVIQDVGLVEYSLFVPLVAIAADTRERVRLLIAVLALGGLGALVVNGIVYFLAPDSRLGPDANPGAAVGIYLALLVVFALARWLHRVPVPRYLAVATVPALVLMALTVVRSILLALVASLAVLVLLASGRLRALALSVGAVAVALVGALGVQATGLGWAPVDLPPAAFANPSYVSDDGASGFSGGTQISGDAASGRFSRQLAPGEALALPHLNGLVPGQTYTVVFGIRPLIREVVRGSVGDLTGAGWGSKEFAAPPRATWQKIRVRLTATEETERLGILPASSAGVRVDAVGVVSGTVGTEGPVFPIQQSIADRSFVADDGASAFVGGRWIAGHAAAGRFSRELAPGEFMRVDAIRGLVPRRAYTVILAVRPLAREVVRGAVGDTSGGGWRARLFATAPRLRWQKVVVALRATKRAEELDIASLARVPFRVDAIRVVPGRRAAGRSGAVKASGLRDPALGVASSAAAQPGPQAAAAGGEASPDVSLTEDIEATFGNASASGSAANVRWRLAYWRFIAER
ncbi:MAG: hypothetical protein ICV74_07620, partial [Thermoleophilia bacterium]|nr:hypothetical protein [Thermoleophilia bacterium]